MTALLLIDIQNDFLPGGALAVPEGDAVIPVANRLMRDGGYDLIVASQDWHPADHPITANDMGIMSNGQVKAGTGARQLIEGCAISKNGDAADPGYNHNLYLGGTSVTVRACDISASLTGHNLKSRAHQNWIEYNFIHDSANRELDLVDEAANTDQADSDTLLLGNVIRKSPAMTGNKTVIHFGQDGKADHTGTLTLVHNTITTPYQSPVVDLSSPGARLALFNNDFRTPARSTTLFTMRNQASPIIGGAGNLFPKDAILNPPSLAGALIPWSKLDLPWKTFNQPPAAFRAFKSAGVLQAATGSISAGATGEPPKP